MKRKVAIIGTGYVGLTTGICFAYLGHDVICVDKDKSKIKNIKKGIIPIYEPGLKEILEKYQKNISFTTDLKDAVQNSEIIFVCVGTPAKRDGSIELTQFKKAIKEIAECLNGRKVVVNKSTVPVGTGDWTKKEIKKYYKGKFFVLSNPEFLREGSAVKDSLEPDRIVIGTEDESAKEIILDIYSSIAAPKLVTDVRSAELIKYAANAFLATKISFINEIANLCERTGGDVNKVAEGIGLDKRIGKSFLNAGIGYGGSCFPKDISGLIKISDQRNYNFKLIRAVAEVNEDQQKNFVGKIIKVLKKNKGKVVGIWGLSFKPNTDDIRKSPAIEIIKSLQKKHYRVQVYDPVAIGKAKKELSTKNIKFCKSPLEAAKNADVLALVTDWPEFSEINMKKLRSLMYRPYFFDGRNQFDPSKMKKIGFYYEGIGRK
jgi:UDPglucose 6-dehydrogenase